MRILLTGASGYLGNHLFQVLSRDHDILGTQYSQDYNGFLSLDITHYKEVKSAIEDFQPDCVIHSAAITDCEINPKLAQEINVNGTEHLLSAVVDKDVPFIFISSAAVFDGKRGWFSEKDVPYSNSLYGKTKIQGEKYVQSLDSPFLIVRPSWLAGTQSNNTKRSYQKIIEKIKDGETVSLDNSWSFTPSYLNHVSTLISKWLKTPISAIRHVATPNETTKYQFFRKVLENSPTQSRQILMEETPLINENPRNLLKTEYLSESPEYLNYEYLIKELRYEIEILSNL